MSTRETMEFICSCRETPTDSDNPPYVYTRSRLVTHDVDFTPLHINRAAYYGDIEGLKYAHKKGRPWNEFTCRTAAVKGHLVCLQYLHENGCPWDKTTIEYAEMGRPYKGHADCVEYAKKHGCPSV